MTALQSVSATQGTLPWRNHNFLEPIHQETALRYVYSYLRNNPEDFNKMLSDSLTAQIIRNGHHVMSGKKKELVGYMNEHFFSNIKKVQYTGLKISGGEEPCIELQTLQFQEDITELVNDTIKIKITLEEGAYKVASVVHSCITQILPPATPSTYFYQPE